jgi:DNA-3-methyladenine glycosylase I
LLVSYCRIAPGHSFHGPYHDREYGFPQRAAAALFERLALEINQPGLSWITILQQRALSRRQTTASISARRWRAAQVPTA